MTANKPKHMCAYTLIELLVVIAIIDPGELDSERYNKQDANYLFFDGHVQLLRWKKPVPT